MLIELQAELDEVIQPLGNHAVEFFFGNEFISCQKS